MAGGRLPAAEARFVRQPALADIGIEGRMRPITRAIAALALLAPVRAVGQTVSVGIKAGLDQAHWYGDFLTGSNPYRSNTGPVAGATLAVGVKEVVAIEIEALYARKGATGSGGFRMDMGYVETPVLLKLVLPLWALPVRPMLLVGVAPAWEVGCSALAEPMVIPENPPPGAVPTSCSGWRSEHHDLGGVLAGGLEAPMGRVRLTAELRYTRGRTNIAQAFAPLTTYNRAWSFMVGSALVL